MRRTVVAAAALAATLLAVPPAPIAASDHSTAAAGKDYPRVAREDRPRARDAGARAPRVSDDSVLVRVADGRRAEAAWERIGRTDWYEVPTPSRRARARLANHRAVAAIEPNYVRGIDAVPNDAVHIPKWGPRHYLRTIRAPGAWDVARAGASEVIAVLDTGVALRHEDLAASIVPGRDLVNDDAAAQDDNGHGTAVAGIAGGRADNGKGIAGVGWRPAIMPVKVLDANGFGTDADIAAGIIWATDNGADVINMSFGGSASSRVLREAVAYAAANDVVLVAAAGNSATALPSYPAAYDAVIGVSATDWDGNTAWFSNFGQSADIAAPGYSIVSTALKSTASYAYARSTGTSIAAPMVAGAAALVRAHRPAFSGRDVTDALLTSARDAGLPGHDPTYGAGILDARGALEGSRQPAVVAERDSFEPNGFAQQATPLAVSQQRTATISPAHDVDWYVYEDTSEWWLQFTASPPTPQSTEWWTLWGERAEELDVNVAVYGADLRLLGEIDAEPPTQVERLVLPPNTSSRYYIRVSGAGPSRGPGPYQVAVGRFIPNHTATGFLPYANHPVDGDAVAAAISDVTGDGRNDVIMTTAPGAYGGIEAVWVYRQRNDGFLTLDTVLPLARRSDPSVSANPVVTAGDFDGDGRNEIIASSPQGLSVYWQREGGLAGPYRTGVDGWSPVAVNLDSSARDEILVRDNDTAYTVRWTPDGWVRNVAVQAPPGLDQEVLDVTGDGLADLVTLTDTAVQVNAGLGNRTFATPAQVTSLAPFEWFGPWGIGAGDVTGDGRNDVVVSDWAEQARIRVLAQRSDGTLAAPVDYRTYANPETIEVGDVNNDGRGDVVVIHGGYMALGVHLQKSDGTLAAEELTSAPYATHYSRRGLAVGDFTNDGYDDVAVGDYNYGTVVFRRQTAAFPQPRGTWVIGGSPNDAAAGVPPTVAPTVKFGRAMDAAHVTASTVRLFDGITNKAMPASVAYDSATRVATLRPATALTSGRPYRVVVTGVRDTAGSTMDQRFIVRFAVGPLADSSPPETTITGGPDFLAYSGSSPFFGFNASTPGGRFQCRWAGEPWIPCTSPTFSSSGMPNDATQWIFEVRATDGAGNVDATPAQLPVDQSDGMYPPNDGFPGQTLSGAGGTVSGTTTRANGDTFDPPNAAPGGNTVWYSWKAPFTGDVVFDTPTHDFDPQIGVHVGAELYDLRTVAVDDDSGAGLAARVRFRAVEGRTYRIVVEGFYDGVYWSMGAYQLRWRRPG